MFWIKLAIVLAIVTPFLFIQYNHNKLERDNRKLEKKDARLSIKLKQLEKQAEQLKEIKCSLEDESSYNDDIDIKYDSKE